MITTIETLVKLYLDDLKDGGLSKNTIRNYKTNLNTLTTHFGHLNPKKFDHTHLDLFQKVVKIKVSGDGKKILHSYLQILYFFLKWCEIEKIDIGLSSADVHAKVKKLHIELYPEQRKYQGPYLSEKELLKLDLYWRKNTAERTLMALRNRTIVYLLGEGGLKPGELVRLKRSAFLGDFVRVNIRKVPLSSNAANIVRQYIARRPDFADDMIVGYSSFDPDKMITHPLSIREVQRIVKKTAHEVGILKAVNPHVLRNSRLTRALLDEMSAKDIVKYFGLAESNSSHQRFLLQARKLRGINEGSLTTKQLSLKLSISMQQALNLIKSGTISSIKFRGDYYIDLKDYSEYMIHPTRYREKKP